MFEVMPKETNRARSMLFVAGWIQIALGIVLPLVWGSFQLGVQYEENTGFTLVKPEAQALCLGFCGDSYSDSNRYYDDDAVLETENTPAIAWVLLVFVVFVGISGILSVTASRGIVERKKWGRTLGIVAGCLILEVFPVGTIVGGIIIADLTGTESLYWFHDHVEYEV